jgi:sensor domain CHASE-containing protein
MALCLYFLKVNSVLGIILALVVGSTVFGIALFLFKAFTEQDKRLIKQTLGGIVPWLR